MVLFVTVGVNCPQWQAEPYQEIENGTFYFTRRRRYMCNYSNFGIDYCGGTFIPVLVNRTVGGGLG